MPAAARTFRVFVSSTFDDLNHERDTLRQVVFPRLQELCRRHGATFLAVDLRWGISEEAAVDQRTMDVCLYEVDRCRTLSTQPNFMILLGDRYGWLPPPPHIPDGDFDVLRRQLAPGDRDLLDAWYVRDTNAVPPRWDLRARSGPLIEPAAWGEVERRLQPAIRTAAIQCGLAARPAYTASAVEQEIAAGLLGGPDVARHVFAFIRTTGAAPPGTTGSAFVETDPQRRQAVYRLHEQVRQRLGSNVREYATGWVDGEPDRTYLPRLADDVYQALERVILDQVQGMHPAGTLEEEISAHQRFSAEVLASPVGAPADADTPARPSFVGRRSELDLIAAYLQGAYLQGNDPEPFGVFAAGGSGKSTLLARAAEQARQRWPGAAVICRFVGATAGSVDVRLLLYGLCGELARIAGDGMAVPTDYARLASTFVDYLAAAGRRTPTLVLLDALDQLSDEHYARNLGWLPRRLPAGVRLVVSTRPGTCLDRLEAMGVPLLQVAAMAVHDGQVLLDTWLASAGRTLQPVQRARVLDGFASRGQPLYLRLVFERARRWRSDEQVDDLVDDIPGVIRDLYAALGSQEDHGAVLVGRALGYLAASRYGLAEDELLGVLSADAEVRTEFLSRARIQWRGGQRLPDIIWSRLRLDLQPYLSERSVDGSTLLAFYHRELHEVAEQDYLAGSQARSRHAALAAAFAGRPDVRGMRELPYHLTQARAWDDLLSILTDSGFLDRKSAALGIEAMLDDFVRAYTAANDRPEVRGALAQRLAGLTVADSDRGVGGLLNPASLFDLLAYRDDRELYLDVLGYCTRETFIARHVADAPTVARRLLESRYHHASTLRRLGDAGHMESAARTLREGLAAYATGVPDAASARIVSGMQYDLAYIDYLAGRWRPAIEGLRASAQTARSAGAETRGWISSCVAASVAFHAGTLDADGLQAVLDQARPHFEVRADTSLLAQRWVMNAYAHSFDRAFLSGDRAGAEELFAVLQSDRWLAQYGTARRIVPALDARMFLLRGQPWQACRRYEELLGEELARPDGPSSEEGLARMFLEYGQALAGVGRLEDARAMWERGMRCPDHAGNWMWKQRIERLLEKPRSGSGPQDI
jgi:Domain of unknown function (DUF4062)/AAA ATPase domain